MTGRETIEIMLKCHFQVSDNKMHRLKTICDFLLNGLKDPDHEKRLNLETMTEHVNILARLFSIGNQHDFATVQDDLWALLTNWWNAAKWARREIRVPVEKANLLGDLLKNIIREIENHFGAKDMGLYYTDDILQALIQIDQKQNITDPFLKQRLSLVQNLDLDGCLQYYQQLSKQHGFDDRTHVLLKLLLDKKNRNKNIHSNYKVQEYKQCCIDCEVLPSFNGYIGFRGLNIDSQLYEDYRRLFSIEYSFA